MSDGCERYARSKLQLSGWCKLAWKQIEWKCHAHPEMWHYLSSKFIISQLSVLDNNEGGKQPRQAKIEQVTPMTDTWKMLYEPNT